MELRSPLARVRGLGPTKEGGTGHWWSQRLTAVMLIPLVAWFLLSLLSLGSIDHATVVVWLSRPLNTILLSIFVVTLVYHSKLGIQVVVEDYVHAPRLQHITLALMTFIHVIIGATGLYAIGVPACARRLGWLRLG